MRAEKSGSNLGIGGGGSCERKREASDSGNSSPNTPIGGGNGSGGGSGEGGGGGGGEGKGGIGGRGEGGGCDGGKIGGLPGRVRGFGHAGFCLDRFTREAARWSLGDDSVRRMEKKTPTPVASASASPTQHTHPSTGTRSVVGCRRPLGTGWYVSSECSNLARSSGSGRFLERFISNRKVFSSRKGAGIPVPSTSPTHTHTRARVCAVTHGVSTRPYTATHHNGLARPKTVLRPTSPPPLD